MTTSTMPVPAVTAPTITGSCGRYLLRWESPQLITIAVSRVRVERGGATTAEILIESPALETPHLYQGRLNLLSDSKKRLGKQLGERFPADWEAMFEQLSVLVLRREREGEPVVRITSQDVVNPRRNLLAPLLSERESTLLFGPGGSGKSFFALFIGVLMASGKAHGGLRLSPAERVNVLYLDWESHEDELRRRIRRLAEPLGVSRPVELGYRRCVASLSDDLEAIQEACREHEIGLLIVDSLVPACGGGEDLMVSGAPSRFFQALRRLDTTAFVVAHPAKNSEAKSIYGSVFFTNLARSVWEVVSHQAAGEDSISLGLFHRKSNLSRLNRPFGVELTFAGDEGPIEARPRDVLSIPSVSERTSVATRIAGLLTHSGALRPVEIAEALGEKEPTVRQALGRMLDREQVVRLDSGRYGARTSEDEPPF